MVTAEAALALPLVAAFALAMVYLVVIGLSKLAVVDAARDAARAVARGDSIESAVAEAERTAPGQATVDISQAHDHIAVTVTAAVEAPGWLLVPLPDASVRSQAVVQIEPHSHVQ